MKFVVVKCWLVGGTAKVQKPWFLLPYTCNRLRKAARNKVLVAAKTYSVRTVYKPKFTTLCNKLQSLISGWDVSPNLLHGLHELALSGRADASGISYVAVSEDK